MARSKSARAEDDPGAGVAVPLLAGPAGVAPAGRSEAAAFGSTEDGAAFATRAASSDADRAGDAAPGPSVFLATGWTEPGDSVFFAADGGAGRIAGIDLTQGGAVIVMLFAVMGIDQIVWGVIDAAVALRWRAFVPLVWAITLAKQLAGALVMWVYKPLPVPAPGKYGALVTLPVLAFALWASLRPVTPKR